jgi:crotonobetainyl-CoA:carnitine CoA-transferase CaiB-like acyl-CoA transferase
VAPLRSLKPTWSTSLASQRPLAGVRVLSMEQAAALPFATRQLADLGADVIRVQSHKRPAPDSEDIEFTRSKRQLAIDLASPGGPEAFRRVAAGCDVVCHNFTPQVVRKFGIDYDSVRVLRPDIIYLELTGFGTDGPWRARPLFGPGAEALAGHNLLIGDPGQWPGRPPTIFYADNTCGLYAVLAVVNALARRDQDGTGSHLDISLYETAVSQIGTVLCERGLGAEPERNLNGDAAFAFQGVYPSAGPGQYIAVSVPRGTPTATAGEAALAATLATQEAADAVDTLQKAGVPAAAVADAAALATDEQLWARGYFGLLERHDHGLDGVYPYSGPPLGGGADAGLRNARPVGDDTQEILAEAGYSAPEVHQLFVAGAAGTGAPPRPRGSDPDPAIRVERGELSRVDPGFRERLEAVARKGQ